MHTAQYALTGGILRQTGSSC